MNIVLKNCCVSCTSILLLLLLFVSTAFAYEKEINTLSAAMAEKISKAGRSSVAVVDFTDLEGNVTQLGRFIAEEFSTALAGAGKGFKVIDRTHLNSIIKEKKLSTTGLIDPVTARKLGKIVGVQALITGTLTPFGENVRVAVKVLDTATAEIIDATREKIAKTQGIEELLGKGIAVATVHATTTTTKSELKKSKIKPSQNGATSGPFSDDFNKGPKPDWKPVTGNWTMANGRYTVIDINPQEIYLTSLEGKKWNNLMLEVEVTPGYINNNGIYSFNICPRMANSQDRVCFGMSGNSNKLDKAYWLIFNDGTISGIGEVSIETSKGQSVHVRIEIKDGVFTSYVNGTKTNQIYNTVYPSGSVGLSQSYQYWDGSNIRTAFDNIKITPLVE
ncbi:MAG: hypothetical protein D3915_11070 [Candidatus Electrothrix sp. AU1_5]|nr:hypothetical protein [Candidatus Electrothrix gigas]